MSHPEIRNQRDQFTLRKLTPHPSLSAFVDSYWFVEGNPKSQGGEGHAVVYPLGYPIVEFNLADKWIKRPQDSDVTSTINSNIMGVMGEPLWIQPVGRIRTVAARLHPLAMGLLIPGSERKNVVFDPELLFGRRFLEAEEQAATARSRQGIKASLDQFFSHVFGTGSAVVDYRVRYVMERIIARRGGLSLRDVVKDLGVSQKRVEQLFREYIGMTPKAYAGIARFQNVFDLYRPGQSLTELAQTAGYYDQSHFIRHFKRFTGRSPRRFFAEEFVESYKISNLYNSSH